ncbi:putative p24 family protein beta-1 [Monocercomonoides exilis]|uniref:putative p24 family protein beta-1 n=1 Tax=Monocercomonoides exilis TaxID=2049356 RepID=UPI00355A07CF|nr:putative p24 family protein beta-1 [Monocercomonoides exilis]|eukprot:MONOS_2469.1-p1 / transcript=MONOS_2469.1 / gene=MONOS_2469 / organism=Monocercomonoides_exilis_PA203 / gene_product=unspecified product / transcript_product=unspecified product / location=Mono_scaffold00051:90126-91029(-) / protein_length=192 / sequence_SO=supercontig / SO=protein_coding / is_pseudo=false
MIFCLLLIAPSFGFLFNMTETIHEGFLEHFRKGQEVQGRYFIVKGGVGSVYLTVTDPNGDVCLSSNGRDEKFSFNAPYEGEYRFKFMSHSSASTKTISFLLEERTVEQHAREKMMSGSELEKGYFELAHDMDSIVKKQDIIKAKEREHRETSLTARKRLTFWGVLLILTVLASSIVHISYLMKLFKNREQKV